MAILLPQEQSGVAFVDVEFAARTVLEALLQASMVGDCVSDGVEVCVGR